LNSKTLPPLRKKLHVKIAKMFETHQGRRTLAQGLTLKKGEKEEMPCHLCDAVDNNEQCAVRVKAQRDLNCWCPAGVVWTAQEENCERA